MIADRDTQDKKHTKVILVLKSDLDTLYGLLKGVGPRTIFSEYVYYACQIERFDFVLSYTFNWCRLKYVMMHVK